MLCKKYLNLFFRPQLKVHIIVLLLQAALSNTRHLVWYFRNKVLKQIKGKKVRQRSETSLQWCSTQTDKDKEVQVCVFAFRSFEASNQTKNEMNLFTPSPDSEQLICKVS